MTNVLPNLVLNFRSKFTIYICRVITLEVDYNYKTTFHNFELKQKPFEKQPEAESKSGQTVGSETE